MQASTNKNLAQSLLEQLNSVKSEFIEKEDHVTKRRIEGLNAAHRSQRSNEVPMLPL